MESVFLGNVLRSLSRRKWGLREVGAKGVKKINQVWPRPWRPSARGVPRFEYGASRAAAVEVAKYARPPRFEAQRLRAGCLYIFDVVSVHASGSEAEATRLAN